MSRSKHLYHLIFVTYEHDDLKVFEELDVWANNKLDLYRKCSEIFRSEKYQNNDQSFWLFDARYIK